MCQGSRHELSCIASLQTASPSSPAVSIVFNISLSLRPSGHQILRTLLPPAEPWCPHFLCHDYSLCRLCHSTFTASCQKDDSFLSAFALVSLSLDCYSDCHHRHISLAGFVHSYHVQNVSIVISIFIFYMAMHNQCLPCPGPG